MLIYSTVYKNGNQSSMVYHVGSHLAGFCARKQ